MKSVARNGYLMKIKCPFCRSIYDPEACDNTCPACSKKLMVAVFKKKPEGKPGAGMATTFKPITVPPTPPPSSVPPPPPPPHPTPAPLLPIAHPETEFVAPKAPALAPVIKVFPPTAAQTQLVMEPVAVPEPEPKVIKVVAPPPPIPVAPPPPVPAPAAHVEKKPAHPGHSKSGLDLVISLQQGTGADWDAVIHVPVQVFKLANLIPARAREAIEAEGIDFEELRKAVERTDEVGTLLDIQTQTQRVHIAIEAHG